MATQTRLSRHNKFISAENITILSVSSDDYLHASLSSQSSKYGVTVRIQKIKKKRMIVFNWNHFEMRLLNLRINFYLFIYF